MPFIKFSRKMKINNYQSTRSNNDLSFYRNEETRKDEVLLCLYYEERQKRCVEKVEGKMFVWSQLLVPVLEYEVILWYHSLIRKQQCVIYKLQKVCLGRDARSLYRRQEILVTV